jgi:hypothetical protein
VPAGTGAPVLLNRDGLNTGTQVIAAQDATQMVDFVGDEAGGPALEDVMRRSPVTSWCSTWMTSGRGTKQRTSTCSGSSP